MFTPTLMELRNPHRLPLIEDEGVFEKPIPVQEKIIKNNDDVNLWKINLNQYERMHAHHTLSSARRYAYFDPYRDRIPQDYLDISLNAAYEHQKELFPEKTDFHYQPETLGEKTWRRLKNTRDVIFENKNQINFQKLRIGGGGVLPTSERTVLVPVVPYKYNIAHPVMISGLSRKRNPDNIQLAHSSHHSYQTNPGYSRQDLDGNLFQY